MTKVTIPADALRFYAQAREDAASVGDIVHLPRGRVGVITATHPDENSVTAQQLPGTARDLESLIKRWFNFTGQEPDHIEVVEGPKQYEAYYQLGTLLAVEYEAKRHGKRRAYRHSFAKHARPALAVSHDGQQLAILGGGFQVTDHGIVDDS